MRLLAIDDLVLADLGIVAEDTLLTAETRWREWSARTREGSAGNAYFGNAPEPAIWSWVLRCPNVAALDSVLAVLTGDVDEQRRLLAQRLDAGSTHVVARAAPRAIEPVGELGLSIEFEGEDSIWTSETATETEKTFTSVLDQAMPVTVPGNTQTALRLVLTPMAQRSTQTAGTGYRWRRRFTVKNNSQTPWYRLPIRVDLGSTTAHVTAARAQADGDDVRLVADGIEQERYLVTWNTAASYLWFDVQNLQPGDSQTYDILSGNSAAVNPPLLTYPNMPPFVLTSTNALWDYPMTAAGFGSWYINRTAAPAAVDFSVPGAWRRALTLDNPDNADWIYSAPYHPPDALVGASIIPKFRAERHPAKYGSVLRANAFDGVELYHPLGISSLTANFQWTNPNTLGTLVILARESASDPWIAKYQNSTLAASATAVAPGAQAFSPKVQHVACAVWPLNGWEMPPDSALVGATAWWDTTLQVAIDTTELSITVEPAWTEVYELATTFRFGGGGNAVPPYRELLVGNADDADGAGTPRATITLAQSLVIDCEDYTHEVWSQVAGEEVAYVERFPAHAVVAVEGWSS